MPVFQHMELNTTDPKAAKKFYGSVFGWKFEDMKMPEGVYSMIRDGKTGIGGIQQKPMPDAPTMWLGYVTVPSLSKAMAKAKKGGATIIVPSMEVPGMGTFGIFQDPQGAPIAVWQATARRAPAKKRAKKKGATKKGARRTATTKAKTATRKTAKRAKKK